MQARENIYVILDGTVCSFSKKAPNLLPLLGNNPSILQDFNNTRMTHCISLAHWVFRWEAETGHY